MPRLSRWADGREEFWASSRPYHGKISLKADETKVGQRHADVGRKQDYYIIIFPESDLKIYIQKQKNMRKNKESWLRKNKLVMSDSLNC